MKLLGNSFKRVIMLVVVLLILLTITSDAASAISNFTDDSVDADSNIDSSPNKGSGFNKRIIE